MLGPDVGYAAQWRQALRVVSGETRAAAQVRVIEELPADLPGFAGRRAELSALECAEPGEVHVIAGMAGVGKTRLAVRAARRLVRAGRFGRVLYVSLRGFHPDPAQPPADPTAVLDGFLRLLGVPVGFRRIRHVRGRSAARAEARQVSADRRQQARARHGTGRAYVALGRRDEAEIEFVAALESFTRQGIREADIVRRDLAALRQAPPEPSAQPDATVASMRDRLRDRTVWPAAAGTLLGYLGMTGCRQVRGSDQVQRLHSVDVGPVLTFTTVEPIHKGQSACRGAQLPTETDPPRRAIKSADPNVRISAS